MMVPVREFDFVRNTRGLILKLKWSRASSDMAGIDQLKGRPGTGAQTGETTILVRQGGILVATG